MASEDIQSVVGDLKRRHAIQKWIELSVGLVLVIGGFAAIVHPDLLSLLPDNPAILFPPVGGAMVGAVAKNWRGSPALRELEKSIS